MTRLTLPLRFSGQRAALALIRSNGLFSIGAQTLWTPEGWRVVIDTARPEAVIRYLGEKLPGVTWIASDD
jgi:uncharacterized protein YbdZ (MbtH family)